MKINDHIGLIMFLTDSLLLKKQFDENFLINIISRDDFPCNNVISQLNEIIGKDLNRIEVIREYNKIFLDNKNSIERSFNTSIDSNLLLNEEFTIISSVGCEMLLFSILKYGKFKETEKVYKIEILLLLILIATSIYSRKEKYMQRKKDDRLLLMLNQMQYYQLSNLHYQSNIIRTNYIYEKYIANIHEFNNIFIQKYNYDIISFVDFLNTIMVLRTSNHNYINEDVFKIILDSNCSEILSDVKLDLSEQETRDKINILFQIYPEILNEKFLLKCDNRYQVINYKRLSENVYSNFINKIRKAFPNEKIFNRKYGDLIEIYCRDLVKSHVSDAKNKYYHFIDKFKFNKNQDESSDFYVSINDDLLVFEIKSTGRYNETTKKKISDDTINFFEEETDKKVFSPANQIDECITKLKKNKNTPKEITNAKNIFYIIVSEEVIKNNKKFAIEQLQSTSYQNTINPVIYLDLTEFEFLMFSLKKRSKSVISTLKHYIDNYKSSNFIDFVLKEYKSLKFNKNSLLEEINGFERIEKKVLAKQLE